MLPIKLKYINNALVRGGKNSSFANLGFGAVVKFANVLFCAGGGGCFPKRPSGAKCVGKKIETLCSTARTSSIHFVILSCHFQVSPQCRRGDYAWC